MTSRELFKQLHKLKDIKTETDWKISQRDILFSQIKNSSASSHLSVMDNSVIFARSFWAAVPQPVSYFVGLILVISLSLVGVRYLPVKPGNSLYIAKVISERAQLSATFSSESRDKMAMRFATDHAQDIASVLSDPAFNQEANSDQIAKLSQDFKNEITKVQNILPKDTDLMIVADSAKTATSVSINLSTTDKTSDTQVVSPIIINTSTAVATSSASLKKTPRVILDEAQRLFDNKQYENAVNKLKEVNSVTN